MFHNSVSNRSLFSLFFLPPRRSNKCGTGTIELLWNISRQQQQQLDTKQQQLRSAEKSIDLCLMLFTCREFSRNNNQPKVLRIFYLLFANFLLRKYLTLALFLLVLVGKNPEVKTSETRPINVLI